MCRKTIFQEHSMSLLFNRKNEKPCFPILTDLRPINVKDNGEALVAIDPQKIICRPLKDMFPYTGDQIFVRASVREKLYQIQLSLQKNYPKMALVVYYGYRHPDIQKLYFEQMSKKLKINNDEDPTTFEERVNKFIAHPDVAGHPTGGAIDASLLLNGADVNMGCQIFDFDQPTKIQTFSEEISGEEFANRMILRNLFVEAGFSPFDGEWWHFSYGDREWAYNQPSKTIAHYGQVFLDNHPDKSKQRDPNNQNILAI